jgi:hypothetical protein
MARPGVGPVGLAQRFGFTPKARGDPNNGTGSLSPQHGIDAEADRAPADACISSVAGRRGIARWAPAFCSAWLSPDRSDVRLAGERVSHSIGRARRCALPNTELMPTGGLDPLTQAILCLGGLVRRGAEPVVVLVGRAAACRS